MCVFIGVVCQKFRDIVHGQVIHTALHWAKQVMDKVGHTDCLVRDQVIYITIGGVIKARTLLTASYVREPWEGSYPTNSNGLF